MMSVDLLVGVNKDIHELTGMKGFDLGTSVPFYFRDNVCSGIIARTIKCADWLASSRF